MTARAVETGLRERILEQAARLFVQRGYQGISMREIAAAVGVSKAGLYYHFKDKEALFLAILLSSIDTVGALVVEARASGGNARAQLHYFLLGIATRMGGQQAMMRLAEQEAVHLSPEAQQQMVQAYHQNFVGQVQAMLKDAQTRQEVRPLPPKTLTRILLSMAYMLIRAPEGEAEGTVDVLLTVFFEGVVEVQGESI